MTLGEVKRSNIIKFWLPCQKIENILNRIFMLLPGSCTRGGTWGCLGVKNFSLGICDGAPSTAFSSLYFLSSADFLKSMLSK